jgi:putative transposase
MIDRMHTLPVTRQCQLLSLNRSTIYYQPKPASNDDLKLMRRIDEMHLQRPFYGSRRIRDWLWEEGHDINRKRVRRLMQQMGITALYPKANTSRPGKGHKIYPYLLKGLEINRPNQVFCTDVTYIPKAKDFVYLVAVMDWYSRKVLSWRRSNTLESDFCVDALRGSDSPLWRAGDLQHRPPGSPVNQRGLHQGSEGGRGSDQHGR